MTDSQVEQLEQFSDEIRALIEQETVLLLPRLSVLSLELFSLLRTTPNDVLIELACNIAEEQHWMRKLTALGVLKYFKSDKIRDICLTELKNEKREVRNAAALCLSFQEFEPPKYEIFSSYVENESLAVLCGYILMKQNSKEAADCLIQSLQFESSNLTEQNYVMWYACRACSYAFSNHLNQDLFNALLVHLGNSDLKTRKAAAEAVGYYCAECENCFDELEELLIEVDYASTFCEKTHGLCIAIATAILAVTGTHNEYVVQKKQNPPENFIKLLALAYERLPVEFPEQSLNGSYHNALICAILPTSQEILRLLEYPEPLCLDGAISGTIYMLKYFSLDFRQLYLPLKMLTFHESKPISVLAERALNFSNFDYETIERLEIEEFAIRNLSSPSPDVRECAIKFITWYLPYIEGDVSDLKDAIVRCAHDSSGGSLSEMPRKSAYEAFSTLNAKINCDDLINECLQELEDRTPFATSVVHFLSLNRRGLACCCLNAFDAISCDFSDPCRLVCSLVTRDTLAAQDILEEALLLLSKDKLSVSGIARLCFALKHAGMDVACLENRLEYFREQCEDDWFDELFAIHDAYAATLADNATIEEIPKNLLQQCEFDEFPVQSAEYLNYVYTGGKIDEEPKDAIGKCILCREVDEASVAEALRSATVQVEIKQKMCCALIGYGKALPDKSAFDVKANEDVEK